MTESQAPQRTGFDLLGAALTGATLTAVLIPLSAAADGHWPTWAWAFLPGATLAAAAGSLYRAALGRNPQTLTPGLSFADFVDAFTAAPASRAAVSRTTASLLLTALALLAAGLGWHLIPRQIQPTPDQ